MAYVRRMGPADEELEALQRYGGAAAATQVPDAAPTQSATPSGPSPTGSYTNFDRILSANADAAKATAGRMRQGVETSAQKAQGGLADLQREFNTRVTTGSLTQQPSAQQQQAAGGVAAVTSARPESGPTGATYTGQPGQTNVDQWRQYAQTKYSGPESLEALQRYGQVSADTREAQRQLGATASQEGREALLRRQAQPGGYSRGQSRFDAGLTGYVGGQGFEEARKRYGDLEKALTDANAAAMGTAGRAKAFTEQAAKGYGGLVADWEKAEAARNQPKVVGSVGPGGVHSTGKSPKKPAWETWDTSLKGKAATSLGTAAKLADPLSWFDAYNKLGVPDPHATGDEMYRGAAGSEKGLHPMMTQAVYDSMSDDEWAAFQAMTPDKQLQFIKQREKELGG